MTQKTTLIALKAQSSNQFWKIVYIWILKYPEVLLLNETITPIVSVTHYNYKSNLKEH